MEFIAQPFGTVRLGDFLLAHFADAQWTTFRAAVAFVKRSGMSFVHAPLKDFSDRAEVRITVGVDQAGTSLEALTDLLDATQPGQVFVFRNGGSSTFHPKVYVFKSARRADVLIGSGNLTKGGLFTNYEASLAVSLDLKEQQDAALLHAVEGALDAWSLPKVGTCYALTGALIAELVTKGLVATEADMQLAKQAAAAAVGQLKTLAGAAPLFVSVAVPSAPVLSQYGAKPAGILGPAVKPGAPAVNSPSPVLLSHNAGHKCFVMTLQKTDVGVGQTTPNTSRRSPEIFIPLAALDQEPGFWGFPGGFTADAPWNAAHPQNRRNGLGKLDRLDVPMRVNKQIAAVRMFFNPRKRDFRLGNEMLRSAGSIGDIVLVRRSDATDGFEYDIEVAPKGSPYFETLLPLCTASVPNSQKYFGYF